VILDRDKFGQTPERDQRIAGVAATSGFEIVWQRPCHEALLLRHLDGCAQLRPPSTPIACQRLDANWPDYKKPMPSARLAQRLDLDAVVRAAAVEPELSSMLQQIGLI
jgi:hypothetical protein